MPANFSTFPKIPTKAFTSLLPPSYSRNLRHLPPQLYFPLACRGLFSSPPAEYQGQEASAGCRNLNPLYSQGYSTRHNEHRKINKNSFLTKIDSFTSRHSQLSFIRSCSVFGAVSTRHFMPMSEQYVFCCFRFV